MSIDKIEEATKILKEHNKWRRGDDEIEMVNPTILGEAIDIIVEYIENIEDF